MNKTLLTILENERLFDHKFVIENSNCGEPVAENWEEIKEFNPSPIRNFIRASTVQLLQSQIEEWKGMMLTDTGNEKMARHASEGEMMKEFKRFGHNSALLTLINSNEEVIKLLQEK